LSHTQIIVLSTLLVFLILLAAFFSCAETALMAINRYRLRHRARMKKDSAMLILHLLKRPDRLLGMILIGNNFSNIFASALTTLIAVHYWGEKGVFVSTLILTFFILIFAEVAPKTVAALYPEKTSRIVAWPVYIFLKLFYPIVWFTNAISNGVLRILGFRIAGHKIEPLSREELRSVVYETASRISRQYQDMLISILDLNKIVVDDVMIPRHEIIGIDLEESWEKVLQHMATSQYDWVPVYRDDVNQVLGILHLRDITHMMVENKTLNKEILISHLHEPYFVPEGTPLNIQLNHFQQKRKRFALVVDEYGEIKGLITLEDILEEIVGEFTTNVQGVNKVQAQSDGSYLADGAVTVREFNRATQWKLPTNGPRTLNGLIVEYLEAIPHTGTCVRIADHPIEILQVKENRVKMARVFPRFKSEEPAEPHL
jgi:Mg2+/Co2+ transporter CorB